MTRNLTAEAPPGPTGPTGWSWPGPEEPTCQVSRTVRGTSRPAPKVFVHDTPK
ncbi:hypothetical protein [Streptomyces sp. NPDC014685]|uniref:hypothetical protein n=1 Tax=Streptomyces sp. NPDC014685 TaxID=3364881 RepID=UPI0036F9D5C5